MTTSDSSPILNAEQRSWNYWFVDGLPNLMAGILCMLLSGAFILIFRYRHTHNLLVFALLAIAFVMFIVLWLRLRQTLEWLKSRITYRRTGYSPAPYFTENDRPPADLVMLNLSSAREKETSRSFLVSEDLRWRVWVMLPILIAEPLAGRFISSHALCVLAGCVGGVLAWLVSRKDARKAWAVVFGLLFAQIYTVDFLSRPNVVEGAFYFLAGVGFVLALAGAIMLMHYLRRNPVAGA